MKDAENKQARRQCHEESNLPLIKTIWQSMRHNIVAPHTMDTDVFLKLINLRALFSSSTVLLYQFLFIKLFTVIT